MKNFKILSTIALGALITFNLTACKDKTNTTETVKQIQLREGVPIEVTQAQLGTFPLIKKYSAEIKGQLQKSVYAALPEYIRNIPIKIGQRVSKGQIIATLDQAGRSPQYRQAKAQYEMIEVTKKRMEDLLETGGISKQELDKINAQYTAAKATYDAAKQNVNIEAPINGVITDIYMREGEVAIAGKDEYPLLQISDISKVIATIKVPANQIYDFKVGLKAKIHINGQTLTGQVVKVPLAANKITRYFNVDVLFANPEMQLRPGMFSQLEIEVREAKGVKIPIDALVMQDDKAFCYLEKNGIAQKYEFKPLLIADHFVVADSAIAQNTHIITSGLSLLKEGVKVKVIANKSI